MSTQLALELLLQTQHNFATFLAGLGLLGNEAAIAQLQFALDEALIAFQQEYQDLKTAVEVNTAQVETQTEKLTLAQDLHQVETERSQSQ